MSEELKRLKNDLSTNAELRKKMEETAKRIAESGEAKSDGEILVKAAAELGYAVKIADFERAMADDEELDPEELKQSAGGVSQCFTDYNCYNIVNHSDNPNPELKRKSACFSEYVCLWIFSDCERAA